MAKKGRGAIASQGRDVMEYHEESSSPCSTNACTQCRSEGYAGGKERCGGGEWWDVGCSILDVLDAAMFQGWWTSGPLVETVPGAAGVLSWTGASESCPPSRAQDWAWAARSKPAAEAPSPGQPVTTSSHYGSVAEDPEPRLYRRPVLIAREVWQPARPFKQRDTMRAYFYSPEKRYQ